MNSFYLTTLRKGFWKTWEHAMPWSLLYVECCSNLPWECKDALQKPACPCLMQSPLHAFLYKCVQYSVQSCSQISEWNSVPETAGNDEFSWCNSALDSQDSVMRYVTFDDECGLWFKGTLAQIGWRHFTGSDLSWKIWLQSSLQGLQRMMTLGILWGYLLQQMADGNSIVSWNDGRRNDYEKGSHPKLGWSAAACSNLASIADLWHRLSTCCLSDTGPVTQIQSSKFLSFGWQTRTLLKVVEPPKALSPYFQVCRGRVHITTVEGFREVLPHNSLNSLLLIQEKAVKAVCIQVQRRVSHFSISMIWRMSPQLNNRLHELQGHVCCGLTCNCPSMTTIWMFLNFTHVPATGSSGRGLGWGFLLMLGDTLAATSGL